MSPLRMMVKPHLRPVRLFFVLLAGSRRMRVILNGEESEIRNDVTVADLLGDLNISLQYGAVAVNRRVVRKKDHDVTRLKAGDRIEIVRPVGGG